MKWSLFRHEMQISKTEKSVGGKVKSTLSNFKTNSKIWPRRTINTSATHTFSKHAMSRLSLSDQLLFEHLAKVRSLLRLMLVFIMPLRLRLSPIRRPSPPSIWVTRLPIKPSTVRPIAWLLYWSRMGYLWAIMSPSSYSAPFPCWLDF